MMHKLADSAPGPDVVRYSAWRAGGSDAVDTIHALAQEMCAGMRHVGLHDALFVFLLKASGGRRWQRMTASQSMRRARRL